MCAAPALQTASETPKIALAPSLAETNNKEQTTHSNLAVTEQAQAGDVDVIMAIFLHLNAPNSLGQKDFSSVFWHRSIAPLKLASMEWLLGEKYELSKRENFDCFLSQWEHAIQLICTTSTAEEW